MLNLSDKELDRLSREAADRHDPGDLAGPQSWERLELRLDKELGRMGPSPLQGLRRFPLYYAPVIILLVGVSYYFIRQGKGNTAKTDPSGSPPMTVVKPQSAVSNGTNLSTKTSENSENSTPSNSAEIATAPNTSVYPGAKSGPDPATTKEGVTPSAGSVSTESRPTGEPGTAAASSRETATTTGSAPTSGTVAAPTDKTGAAPTGKTGAAPTGKTGSTPTGNTGSAPASGSEAAPGSTGSALAGIKPATTTTGSAPTTNTVAALSGKRGTTPTRGYGLAADQGSADSKTTGYVTRRQGKSHHTGPTPAGTISGSTGSHGLKADGSKNPPGPTDAGGATAAARLAPNDGLAGSTVADRQAAGSSSSKPIPREPAFSTIQDAHSLARQRGVDDSALRAAAASGVAGPIRLDKKNPGLRISRPLQFGFSFSPDFASVHSLAGDRPGSSIGLTLDYQFSDRLYLSTGLLATRKNYASSPQDYHVPDNYYIRNNIHDVSLIKGSFYMLEIPLNLRYDFLLTGNTVFFLSGGASSYLMTSEHSQYYYNLFGRQTCQDFKGENARRRNYLFSAINLSMGVETGLSNSLSLLIAPYVKVPTAGMGFGQVQITSVGLNFALKYAPVLSRKRQH